MFNTTHFKTIHIIRLYDTFIDDNCVHYSTCSGGDTKHNTSQAMEDASLYVYSASTILELNASSKI